jgi:hypothetical protein
VDFPSGNEAEGGTPLMRPKRGSRVVTLISSTSLYPVTNMAPQRLNLIAREGIAASIRNTFACWRIFNFCTREA